MSREAVVKRYRLVNIIQLYNSTTLYCKNSKMSIVQNFSRICVQRLPRCRLRLDADSKLPSKATSSFFFVTTSYRPRLRNFSSSSPQSVASCTLYMLQNKAGTYPCALGYVLGISNSAAIALSSRFRPYISSVQYAPFHSARTGHGSLVVFRFAGDRSLRTTVGFPWRSVLFLLPAVNCFSHTE